MHGRLSLFPAAVAAAAFAVVVPGTPAQTGFLGKSVSQWLDRLKDPDPRARRGAAFALSRSGSGAALPALARALADPDGGVRDAAAYGLGEVAADRGPDVWAAAGPQLLRMLTDDPDPRARRSAAYAVGRCGPAAAGARAALLKAVADPGPAVRQNAAWALGRLGPEAAGEVVGGLGRALADADAAVRRDAAAALAEIGPAAAAAAPALAACVRSETDPSARKGVLDALVRVVTPQNKELASELAGLLRHPDREVVRGAALALGKIGGPTAAAAVPALSEALHGRDPAARELAAATLAQVGEAAAAAVPDLIDALGDDSPAVRRNAAVALARLRDKAVPAVPALARALDPAQPREVRVFAAEALWKIGPAAEQAVPALLRVLREDADPLVRQRVIYPLSTVRTPQRRREVLAALEAVLREQGPATRLVRYDAARALAFQLGPQAPPRVIEVLLEMLNESALRLNQGATPTVRTGEGSAQAPTAVEEGLGGDGRFLAAEALARLGPRANTPEVVRALEEAGRSDDKTTREAAHQALRAIRR